MNIKVKVETVNNVKTYTVQSPAVTYTETDYTEDNIKARALTLKKLQKEKENELELINAELTAIKEVV
jgi:hypothetical protein